MKKILRTTILLLASWFVLHTAVISLEGLIHRQSITADVAVVLGNKVEVSGLPSARLDRAVGLVADGQVQHVIVSGGVGETGFSEADIMRDYLVESGISPEHIIIDAMGNSTEATARNTAELLVQHELQDVIIVSQFYHLSRSRMIFKKYQIPVAGTAHARYFALRDLYSLAREFPAFYKYLFLA